jgi:hypothetical protein
MPVLSRMRRISTARITSDALAVTKVAVNAIQASTDAVPHLKSAVSAVIVLLEMSEERFSLQQPCELFTDGQLQKIKSNRKESKPNQSTLRSARHAWCRIYGDKQRISVLRSHWRWRGALLRSKQALGSSLQGRSENSGFQGKKSRGFESQILKNQSAGR